MSTPITTCHKPTDEALQTLRTCVQLGSPCDLTKEEAFLIWEHIARREFAWWAVQAQADADAERRTAIAKNINIELHGN